ncbi:MAG: TadZ/CpaE-like protein [Deltaproteobacteria bacterium]|nr:TadZ/CpaE-like protein [Deltaproteobacteria bacterium]
MTRTRHHLFRDQRGQELIEFVLVMPLLVLMLAGGVEFGRAFYTYNILTKSVRNAARYLSDTQISPVGPGVIAASYVTKAQNLAVFGTVSGTGTRIVPGLLTNQINVATAQPRPGQFYVTVTANYPYPPVFGFLLPGITFRPKVTMLFVGVVVYGT